MSTEEKSQAYDEALKQATKELQICGSLDCDAARQIFRLFPQLAESEEERIRKILLKMAKVPRKEIYEHEGITKEQAIPYLEKQKELDKMIVVSPEVWDNAISDAYENGKKDNEKQKENPEEPKIAFGDWGDKEKKEAIFTCLKYMRFIKKITNQEYNDLTEWLGSNLIYNLLGNGWYLKQKEQKPAEWSDTNELVFKDICNHLKEEGYNGWVVLLNELCNGEFQPKPDWSEEDEEMLNSIIKVVCGIGEQPSIGLREKQVRFLKSLRPHWKPSEEQMEVLEYVIRDYREDSCNATANYLQEILDHLKNM